MAQNLTLLAGLDSSYLSTAQPWYHDPNPKLWGIMSDFWLSAFAPFVAHWLFCALFEILDRGDWQWVKKYRIHESSDITSRNLVTRRKAITTIIIQQATQIIFTCVWMSSSADSGGQISMHVPQMEALAPTILRCLEVLIGRRLAALLWMHKAQVLVYYLYWWAIPLAQIFAAILVMDTWQYFIHRAMHMNAYLYKTFHSHHHRLYVTYASATMYQHPVEALLVDMFGAALSEKVVGMSTRQATLLFTLATLKTIDDHCGYSLPFDPLQWFSTGNNADYHDIHHQPLGMKSNFSQPFCMHWDAILGTRMTRQEFEARKGLKNKEAKAS